MSRIVMALVLLAGAALLPFALSAPAAAEVGCSLPGKVVINRAAFVVAQESHGNGKTDLYESERTSVTRTCWKASGEVREIHRGRSSYGGSDQISRFAAAGPYLVYIRDHGSRNAPSDDEVIRLNVRTSDGWVQSEPNDVYEVDVSAQGDVAWIREGMRRGREVLRVEVRRGDSTTHYGVGRAMKNISIGRTIVSWVDGRRKHRRALREYIS